MKTDLCLRPNWQILGSIRLGNNDLRALVIKRQRAAKYEGVHTCTDRDY
jgi:hypothetical protein